MKKIDIHCHTTTRKLEDTVSLDASISQISNHMTKHEIETSVLLASYFPFKGSGISNFRLFNWILPYDDDFIRYKLFGSLDFEHYFYQGFNELEELSQMRVLSGIKIYASYQNIDLGSGKFAQMLGLAGKSGIPVMIHAGHSHRASRTGKSQFFESHPLEYEQFIQSKPEVNYIFSHLANPFTEEVSTLAKKYPNVYSDMSGLVDSFEIRQDSVALYAVQCAVESIRKFIGECGPKKLLFGTDFPVQTHEDSIFFLEEAMKGYSLEDKADVYYNNAKVILK